MKRALVPMLGLAVALAGCGGGDEDSSTIRSRSLTIYSSVPRHGTSAAAGEAAFAGQRRALEEARGRAGGRRIRLVRLSSTRAGDLLWDPGTVEANAQRARRDPSAVAYLGEIDAGGSAISLPVTNRARLLQVSPADGLTSLTRRPPGRPRAGPERYYPERLRTFVRLVASDLVLADALVALLGERGAGAAALVHGERIADRELTAMVVSRLRRRGHEPAFVEPLPREDEAPAALVERVAASRPAVVLYLDAGTPTARATVTTLARRLPSVPVVGSSGLAVPGVVGRSTPHRTQALTPILPRPAQPAAGRGLLRAMSRARGRPLRPEALYGYESMRLVLAAIERGGADRRAVVREALAPRIRRTALGRLSIARGGDVRPGRLALLDLGGGRRVVERVTKADH